MNVNVVTPTKKGSGKEDGTSKDSNLSQHLTPFSSGKSAGAWSMPPSPFGGWWFPGLAPAPAACTLFGWLQRGAPPGPDPTDPCTSSKSLTRKHPRVEKAEDSNSEAERSDVVGLLDEAEARSWWSL